MNTTPPDDERERTQKCLDLAAQAMERLNAELNELQAGVPKLTPEEAAAQQQQAIGDGDPEFQARWAAMSEDEKLEWSRHVHRVLVVHRDELKAMNLNGLDVDATLKKFRKIEAKLGKVEGIKDEIAGWLCQITADKADVDARVALNLALLMQHWEGMDEKTWASATEEQRAKMTELLTEWRNGQREVWLSRLPIDVRRQFE